MGFFVCQSRTIITPASVLSVVVIVVICVKFANNWSVSWPNILRRLAKMSAPKPNAWAHINNHGGWLMGSFPTSWLHSYSGGRCRGLLYKVDVTGTDALSLLSRLSTNYGSFVFLLQRMFLLSRWLRAAVTAFQLWLLWIQQKATDTDECLFGKNNGLFK